MLLNCNLFIKDLFSIINFLKNLKKFGEIICYINCLFYDILLFIYIKILER